MCDPIESLFSNPQSSNKVSDVMNMQSLLLSAVALAFAGQVVAAPPAAAPSRPAVSATAPPAAVPVAQSGPSIPWMCILGSSQAIAASKAGAGVRTRMEQLVAQVRAELQPEDTAIAADAKALDAARPTLDQATFQARGQAINARVGAFREKADLRQRELKATEDKAYNRIAQELDPIATSIYQQRHCSVLLDRGAVLAANGEMDITPAVVAALDAKNLQLTIEREHLDTAPPPAR